MVITEAMQIVDGALLSDACVASNHGSPYFKLGQEGTEHADWLELVRGALIALGNTACDIKTIIRPELTSGVWMEFWSHASDYLTGLRERWYPNGVKAIPTDLDLTPISITSWFEGDGCTTRLRGREYYVRATLCTQGFTDEEVRLLADKLKHVGVNMYSNRVSISQKKSRGLVLLATSVSEVNRLMDTIEPHILPSYQYKIKRAFFSRGEMERCLLQR